MMSVISMFLDEECIMLLNQRTITTQTKGRGLNNDVRTASGKIIRVTTRTDAMQLDITYIPKFRLTVKNINYHQNSVNNILD